MAGNGKPPVLVILQLTGGNDYFNTLIPYNDGNYYDMRPSLQVPQDRVLKLDDTLGMHPAMGPMKEIYDSGDMADMPTHRGLTSDQWTSGTPVSQTPWAPKAGWAALFERSTPMARTL